MALNTVKCNHLMPLHFKGLNMNNIDHCQLSLYFCTVLFAVL